MNSLNKYVPWLLTTSAMMVVVVAATQWPLFHGLAIVATAIYLLTALLMTGALFVQAVLGSLGLSSPNGATADAIIDVDASSAKRPLWWLILDFMFDVTVLGVAVWGGLGVIVMLYGGGMFLQWVLATALKMHYQRSLRLLREIREEEQRRQDLAAQMKREHSHRTRAKPYSQVFRENEELFRKVEENKPL